MSKGQAQIGLIALTGVITFAGSWLGNYVLNSPVQSANAISGVQDDVKDLRSIVNTLCNDYGQTVSRVDQNLQAIGTALKVPIVTGRTNTDPCKTLK